MNETPGRVRQAARPDNPPAALRELARDPDLIVRAAVAINGTCSPELDSILAEDRDERVRALLGNRIAQLLPNLDGDGQTSAAQHVLTTLTALARDQATRVRATIAEQVKMMEVAPRGLVLLLAQDEAAEVSDPILRLSPVLTDADLLLLLATPPFPAAAASIASRPKLSATVADAIVAYADAPAIRALLSNQSACIREATLDALVGRAPHHSDWHAPLVRRPNLSAKAIRALSEFIAADLLRILVARVDLDPAKLEIVRQRLAREIAQTDDTTVVADGIRLKAANALTEDTILEAARSGDTRRVAALLAVAAGVPLQTVDRVADLRSAKALVSLTWHAGFSMKAAVAIQSSLGYFAPDKIITSGLNGAFPLTKEEMEWQVELMTSGDWEAPATTEPKWAGAPLKRLA